MEIFIEWDGIHYPHLCTDYFVNKKAEKKSEIITKIVDEIQGTKTEKYKINKENLDFLKSKGIEHYTIEQSDISGKWLNKLAKEIFGYVIYDSNDLSFLKDFDEDSNYLKN